jgi:hypothetical protein
MTSDKIDHAAYETLAAGYALAALEPDEEERFLAHLPSCALCERAVVEHTETLAHLAYAASSETPPHSLLQGIRAGIVESGRSGEFPAPLRLELARSRRRDRSVRMMTALIGVAASLIVVAALLLANRGLSSQERGAQLDATRLSATVSSLLVPGARKIDLTGTGGRGAVIVNGRSVSLVLTGVAANDRRSSIYVLWEKTTFGDVRAVGSFDVKSSEVSVINDLRLASADTIKTFIVTQEIGRVAPVRTIQPPVLAGDV